MRKISLWCRLVVLCPVLFIVYRAHAAQVITSVTETGGDGTVLAQWTGNSFTGIAPLGAYTVPSFTNLAKIFVDRSHAYANNSGTVPIPSYLNGNDYIMTRNENRDNAGFRLTVNVSQDVIVYMLIDNRIGDTNANSGNPPFNGTAITAWTGMQWINTNGFQPVLTGRNRTANTAVPDEVGIDENADGSINNWFSVYSNRFPAGTFTLLQQGIPGNNMYGAVVAIAPPVVPVVKLVSPATNEATFHPTSSNLVINLTATSPIITNQIKMILNGTDVSSSLVITGTSVNATAIFSSLAANTIYSGTLTASNTAGTTTFNFTLDTFTVGSAVVIEAEDYNYGDGDCQPATPTNPIESIAGGFYFNNPTPGQYQNAIGAIDIDYHDTATNRGDLIANAFRLCDFVGTKVSTDNARAPFIGSSFPDDDVWQMQPNEWLNYTRNIPAGNYNIYLRAISSVNNTFNLDKVSGDASTTSQTTSPLGAFTVPNTSGRYQLVPLLNGLGSNAVINFSGPASTVRLTAVTAANNAQANFILLVPTGISAPPVVAAVSPGANAAGIYPDAVITATIANGDSAVNAGSIVLWFNGVDVTAGATITPTANGATISYDPPGFLAVNSTNLVSLEFVDNAGVPNSFTNTWRFTTVPVLPVIPATYATATGSAADAGFDIRIRKAPNTAPAAIFPASILRAEQHLANLIFDPNTGLPYPNDAAPGVTTASLINFEQTGTNNVGRFNGTNGYPDSTYPFVPFGDPRWTNDPNNMVMEVTAYLQLSAGVQKFSVRSDDGFRVTVGPTFGDTNLVLAQLDAGRGDAPSDFEFLVVSNGVYAFRLLYFEAQGGSSLEFYSINRTNGVPTLINDSVTSGFVPAYRTRTGLPAATPPQIVNVSPANNTFFVSPASPVTFEALAGESSTIAPADVHLSLNGTDVSGSLVIGGTSSDRTASYTGLQPNTPYRAVISVTDSAARTSTRTINFDTFDSSQTVILEAEDYNFGDTACPTTVTVGGAFFDPVPTDSYFGYVGIKGIDYADTSTNLGANSYRGCDFAGVQVSLDAARPAYASTNDYQVWRMQPGEWLNYTRLFPTAAYKAYVRVASTAARQLSLSKVTSDASAPSQTAVVLGKFVVPNTGSAASYQYVPLVDTFGNPVAFSVAEFDTLRLSSVDANNDVAVNFFILVPTGTTSRPWIASASPAPGATRVQPGASISISIVNGGTAVNTGTIALSVDGTNITADASITSDAFGALITYTPSTIWSTGVTHTVQLVFQDNGGPATTISNQWGFTVASGLIGFPIKVNFGVTNSPVPLDVFGYRLDVGETFAARTNGFSYGWDRDVRADGRFRKNINSPDVRYDTFIHMLKAVPAAFWEIVVPNGTYDVRVVGGDPTALDSVFQYDIEGAITGTYIPVAGAWWADLTVSTTVTDGRLTVRSGPASQTVANNNKINFIDITPPITPVAPVVTRNPLPVTVNAGEQATFSVTYRATETLTFQWYRDGVAVAGGTDATLVIPNAQPGNAGAYTVAITNVAGGTVSASAQLTVIGGVTTNALLYITRSDTNVLIYWTNTTVGLSLKQTDDVTPPISWAPVTNVAVNANGNFSITLPADAAKKFFQLRQ